MYNQNMKFVESHEWVRDNGDGSVTIGITDHAQSALGDIVFVELPEVDSNLDKEDALGVVESVKSASDLYSPISGEVVEVNEALEADPTLINSDPHGDGWIARIKLSDASELDDLLSSEQYEELIG